MDKKITKLGLLSFLLAGAIVLPSLAMAYRGTPGVQGPNYTPERHEAMQKAFGENDYDAWAELMAGRGKVTQVVTRDNFAKFAEAHKLALEGKTAEAQQIRQELGLFNGRGMGNGAGMRSGQ